MFKPEDTDVFGRLPLLREIPPVAEIFRYYCFAKIIYINLEIGKSGAKLDIKWQRRAARNYGVRQQQLKSGCF